MGRANDCEVLMICHISLDQNLYQGIMPEKTSIRQKWLKDRRCKLGTWFSDTQCNLFENRDSSHCGFSLGVGNDIGFPYFKLPLLIKIGKKFYISNNQMRPLRFWLKGGYRHFCQTR